MSSIVASCRLSYLRLIVETFEAKEVLKFANEILAV